MTRRMSTTTHVYVVDPTGNTSLDGLESDANGRVRVVVFPTGRAALRTNPDESPGMWFIHMRLPDMDGLTLMEMLRSRGCRVPIALMAEDYSVEDEMAARMSGASLYVTKPLCREMFELTAGHV